MPKEKCDGLLNLDKLKEKLKDPKTQQKKRDKKALIKVTDRRKKIFLRTLAITGQIGKSARAAGYSCSTYLARVRRMDPDFNARWNEAIETAMDVLEEAAIDRAVHGVEEPIYHKGEQVGVKQKYSDGLLATLLKANNPDKYRENTKVDVNVSGGFGIAVLPVTQKSITAWEAQAAIVHKKQDQLMGKFEEVVDAEFEEVEETGLKRS